MNRSQTTGVLPAAPCGTAGSSGITGAFTKGRSPPLSLCLGHVVHVFLTRSPLTDSSVSVRVCPFDLHALATPPAFVLSQDQTLHLEVRFLTSRVETRNDQIRLRAIIRVSVRMRARRLLVGSASLGSSADRITDQQAFRTTRGKIRHAPRSTHTLTTTNLFTCQRTTHHHRQWRIGYTSGLNDPVNRLPHGFLRSFFEKNDSKKASNNLSMNRKRRGNAMPCCRIFSKRGRYYRQRREAPFSAGLLL